MELSLERPDGYLFVRRVAARGVTLIDRELTDSFVLAPDHVEEHWPVHEVAALGDTHIAGLLAMQPEVVLLGTGVQQVFPPAEFSAEFLRKGVGIEIMNNAAAARTYNLLASEGRHVIAAFMLPVD
ncbi:MAG: hypothetical protein EPN56_07920 [Rhodanobacter sp.]|nr:MAG: hypothetical protein EPN78_07940 [Rhodanobacter sp.]TAM11086.1 MAG: hypothetical protein EPN66_08850 [Rhodanobacter sp.]TAM35514.1 MAG: hypothetical protein EPN56_07920 [Rhodanobacter sp.]